MIVLDTNVVSEMMRTSPDDRVAAWFARHPPESLTTTSVTKAEILFGIATLPEGQRRLRLSAEAHVMFGARFRGRLLPFDGDAADRYAEIVAARRRSGTPMQVLDAQIAAIALAAGASVATRDTAGFAGCGLALINPWDAA